MKLVKYYRKIYFAQFAYWAIFIIPLGLILLLALFRGNVGCGQKDYLIYFQLFFPLLTAVILAYVVIREEEEDMAEIIFSSAISRYRLFNGKLVISLSLLGLIWLSSFLLFSLIADTQSLGILLWVSLPSSLLLGFIGLTLAHVSKSTYVGILGSCIYWGIDYFSKGTITKCLFLFPEYFL